MTTVLPTCSHGGPQAIRNGGAPPPQSFCGDEISFIREAIYQLPMLRFRRLLLRRGHLSHLIFQPDRLRNFTSEGCKAHSPLGTRSHGSATPKASAPKTPARSKHRRTFDQLPRHFGLLNVPPKAPAAIARSPPPPHVSPPSFPPSSQGGGSFSPLLTFSQ